MPFDSGYPNGIFIKPEGAGEYTQIDVYRHSGNESDQGHDVTSTSHNGFQAKVPTILRGTQRISGHLKSDDGYPWANSIKAQGTGLIKAQYGTLQEFVMAYYIPEVSYTNETAAGTDFEATFEMNAEAADNPDDTYAYPDD